MIRLGLKAAIATAPLLRGGDRVWRLNFREFDYAQLCSTTSSTSVFGEGEVHRLAHVEVRAFLYIPLRGYYLRIASSVLVSVVLAVFLTPGANAQSGAKALFYGPAGSTANPFRPVGIQYWFENEQKTRFAQAREAGVGARVRLHVQSNTTGFLGVWMTDKSQEGGIQLTPMEGQWTGYLMEPRRDYVVPGEITVPAAESDMRVLILFARSQTEQVRTAAEAREKIRRLSMAAARDGALAIVQETDTSTPGEVGTYVVHRGGAQPGVEIEIRH